MGVAHEQELTRQRVTNQVYDHLTRGRYALYATRVEKNRGQSTFPT